MDKAWIADVLSDLEVFARANGLPRLAHKMKETLTVAEAELSSGRKGAHLRVVQGDGPTPRPVFPEAGTGTNT